MKKAYTAPASEAIDLVIEAPILSGSTEVDSKNEIGIKNDADFLSNKTIWNYNEDDEK